jgi:hypothetical protein
VFDPGADKLPLKYDAVAANKAYEADVEFCEYDADTALKT